MLKIISRYASDNIEAKTGQTPGDVSRKLAQAKGAAEAWFTARAVIAGSARSATLSGPRLMPWPDTLCSNRTWASEVMEQLDDQLRSLNVLGTLLARTVPRSYGPSGDDPHLLEGGGYVPHRGEALGQGRDVADAEIEHGSALDLDPDGPLQNHEHLAR